MIPPAADRARSHVEGAVEALELAIAECQPQRRRRRRDWRARALETIAGDLRLVLDAGCPPNRPTADELARLRRRVAGLQPQLPAGAASSGREADLALSCAHSALEQAIGTNGGGS